MRPRVAAAFMKSAIDSRVERALRRWLWAATALCVLAAALLPLLGSDWVRPVALLPMANCLAVWAFLSFRLRGTIAAVNALRLTLLAGRSGAATDEAARELKAGLRPVYLLFLWPWLLILLTWGVVVVMKPA